MRGTGGGPEKTILLGAAMANPARSQVTVCYLRDQRDPVFSVSERAAEAGVDYVEVTERHSFDPSVWPQLQRLIADRQIDLIHAHEYKSNLLAWMLSKSTAVPALATVHGWTGHSTRERMCYYPIDKRVLARFPRLIAVSSEIASELTKHGADPARVTTVLNGIDHRQFTRDRSREADIRASMGFDSTHKVIGSVGRLEPQKRFDVLLEAFATLHSRRPETRLVIAGDGSQRTALELQRERLGLTDSVTLLGHVTDVIRPHHAFDLFVQSSDYEGTPNSVLEAMALETPAVATAAGGTAELMHDGVHGRIVPIGKPDRLLAAIEAAFAQRSETAAMTGRARERVEGVLSFESRVRRVEAIYEEVAGHA